MMTILSRKTKYRNHISSSENDQNRAQKDNDYDVYDDYDILHSVLENPNPVNETPINLEPKPEEPGILPPYYSEGPYPVRIEVKLLYEEYNNPEITKLDIEICSIRQIPLPKIVNNIYKSNPEGDTPVILGFVGIAKLEATNGI